MVKMLLSRTLRRLPYPTQVSHIQRRFESSQQTIAGKEVSPHIGFYKTFGKPTAKVFLMATFTYQVAYWLWVKLEKDEIQAERQAEITSLETKLRDLASNGKLD